MFECNVLVGRLRAFGRPSGSTWSGWPAISDAAFSKSAANEIAVEAFLDERLRFVEIPVVIERALDAAGRETSVPGSLADVRATDEWTRRFSAETVRTLVSQD